MAWLLAATFGAFGGVAFKLVELIEASRLPAPDRPDLKDFYYWVPFPALLLLGGGLAAANALSGSSLTALAAINIGVTAPLAFRAWYISASKDVESIHTPKDA